MSGSLPFWIEVLRALSVPAIALAGVFIAGANLWLAKLKHQDEIFERQFETYKISLEISEATVPNGYSMKDLQERFDRLHFLIIGAFDEKFQIKLWKIILPPTKEQIPTDSESWDKFITGRRSAVMELFEAEISRRRFPKFICRFPKFISRTKRSRETNARQD